VWEEKCGWEGGGGGLMTMGWSCLCQRKGGKISYQVWQGLAVARETFGLGIVPCSHHGKCRRLVLETKSRNRVQLNGWMWIIKSMVEMFHS